MRNFILLTCLLVAIILSCSNEKGEGWVDYERVIKNAEGDWVSLGGNYMQQHYSHLDLINVDNVKDLGFAWEYDARSPVGRVPHGLEATPFVVDGIMYTSGAWGFVHALDARTGEAIWEYDPKVDASYNRRACCGGRSI